MARVEPYTPGFRDKLFPASNTCQIVNCHDKATKQIVFSYGTKLQICEGHLKEILALKEKKPT